MLKIKLARFGKKGQPHYRIVVNEARDKRDGSYVALLGHYAPAQQPKTLQLDLAQYDEWVKKGAQPTETVAYIAENYRKNPENPFPAKKARPSKKSVAKAAEAAKAAAEAKQAEADAKAAAKAAPAAETPATEAPEVAEAPATETTAAE